MYNFTIKKKIEKEEKFTTIARSEMKLYIYIFESSKNRKE